MNEVKVCENCYAAIPGGTSVCEHCNHRFDDSVGRSYQLRVGSWMAECFGSEISKDKIERNHRFLEEALELVQACECTASEAHQLVDYVFNRPVGEKGQEVGGVKITLAALCSAQGIDQDLEGERELLRIWTKIEQIQLKQATKPKHSPLPEQEFNKRIFTKYENLSEEELLREADFSNNELLQELAIRLRNR